MSAGARKGISYYTRGRDKTGQGCPKRPDRAVLTERGRNARQRGQTRTHVEARQRVQLFPRKELLHG